MKLATPPFRWFCITLLALGASALALVAGSTLLASRHAAATRPACGSSSALFPGRRKPLSPAAEQPRSPQVWVIAIGIDQYRG